MEQEDPSDPMKTPMAQLSDEVKARILSFRVRECSVLGILRRQDGLDAKLLARKDGPDFKNLRIGAAHLPKTPEDFPWGFWRDQDKKGLDEKGHVLLQKWNPFCDVTPRNPVFVLKIMRLLLFKAAMLFDKPRRTRMFVKHKWECTPEGTLYSAKHLVLILPKTKTFTVEDCALSLCSRTYWEKRGWQHLMLKPCNDDLLAEIRDSIKERMENLKKQGQKWTSSESPLTLSWNCIRGGLCGSPPLYGGVYRQPERPAPSSIECDRKEGQGRLADFCLSFADDISQASLREDEDGEQLWMDGDCELSDFSERAGQCWACTRLMPEFLVGHDAIAQEEFDGEFVSPHELIFRIDEMYINEENGIPVEDETENLESFTKLSCLNQDKGEGATSWKFFLCLGNLLQRKELLEDSLSAFPSSQWR